MTVIEALVAVLILSLGLLPTFGIVLSANNFSTSISNMLIAANLAQEGAEIIRAIRDENWFNNRSFDSGLSDGDYYGAWNSISLTPVSVTAPLFRIDSNGLYNYSTGRETLFRRKMTITKIDPGGCNCQLQIVVDVNWLERGTMRSLTIESNLFNWR